MAYNKKTGIYEGYIYSATNVLNNKMYIGQTIMTIEQRKIKHYSSTKNKSDGYAFHNALRKYDEDVFEWNCIEKFSNISKQDLLKELNNAEIEYIKKYNSLCPYGYNTDKGGNSSTKTARPVDCYDINGNFVYSFDSMHDAADYVDGVSQIIRSCVIGEIQTAYGYIWVDKGEEFSGLKPYKYETMIDCYNLDGTFVKTFNNYSEAKNFVGANRSSAIRNCVERITKQSYGYVWVLHGEPFPEQGYRKNIKPVIQLDLQGNYINTFLGGAQEAALEINGNANSIKQCCLGRINTSSGFRWKYDDVNYKSNRFRPVICYTLKGDIVGTYKTAKEASELLNVSISGIYACARGSKDYYGDYVWRYEDEDFSKPIIKNKTKPINQFDLNGNYITTFPSAREASRSVDIDKSTILRRCKSGKPGKGYYWYYADDPNQSDKKRVD